MRLVIAAAMVMAASAAAPAPAGDAPRDVLLTNATVIDGTGAAPLPGVNVFIRDGRIDEIYPAHEARAHGDVHTIDLRGRFIVPGLVNVHVHLTPILAGDRRGADGILRRKLYGGVTTVRDPSGDARLLAALQGEIRAGVLPGPDIVYAALMGGPDFIRQDARVARASQGIAPGSAPWQQEITSTTDLQAAVRRAAGTGAGGIKFYIGVEAALIRAVTREAHASGLRSWAHATVFPDRPLAVVEAGVDVVSHLCGLAWEAAELDPQVNVPFTHTPRGDPRPAFDPARVKAESPEMRALFAAMAARGTLLDATHSLYARQDPAVAASGCTPELMTALARAARQAGVEFATGTDYIAPSADAFPSVLREIESLVDQQVLTPLEAITAATRNGARAAGLERTHGTLERGKSASLVVLNSDPSRDIRALRDILLVLKDGRLYRRADFGR
ncbi:MAG TPA: amidohydrolase family protein [Steroidobacteraceae bacterium]|nr:amidohydrolase family protein [Steroidobacteraceae bacterium]